MVQTKMALMVDRVSALPGSICHGWDEDDEDTKVFVSRKEGTLTLLKARSGAPPELNGDGYSSVFIVDPGMWELREPG